MVTAKESNSSDLDNMGLLQLEQKYKLPYFPPPKSTNVDYVGEPASELHSLKSGQPNAVCEFFKLLPPYWNTSCPTGNSQFALPPGLGVSDKPIDASCTPQKRFLIFDQSGNQTRLFFSPSFSPKNQIIASKTPANADGLCEKVASQVDQQFLVKPVVKEKWDENHLTDGESEMFEDTEEIDALLYSDNDDDYDGEDDDENDEVTSTRHTPFSIEEGYNKENLLHELMEEVASSDGSPKRRRLLDGRYKKSSLACSQNYEDDVESSYACSRNSYDDIDSHKREKKVKIREALKILESIIPGLTSNDPLSIIEKAIVYLESMRIEAEALGHSYPDYRSTTSP